jgi:ABC-type bacteriocin/lantibiotic exporter with double-glycine peptidase domain
MLFAYYGKRISQRRIGRLARTTRKHGTTAERLVRVAKQLGFTASIKDSASFDDIQRQLRRGVPPIVDWFSTDEGHYSVVVGLDKRRIYLADPELARVRALDRATFYRVWFDFRGGHIKRPSDIHLRRMILVKEKRLS